MQHVSINFNNFRGLFNKCKKKERKKRIKDDQHHTAVMAQSITQCKSYPIHDTSLDISNYTCAASNACTCAAGSACTCAAGNASRIPKIIVYFDNIEFHLIHHLKSATYCVGCVAWITNKNIIEAMTQLNGCMLVVQNDTINTIHTKTYKNISHLCTNIPHARLNKLNNGKYHTLQQLLKVCSPSPSSPRCNKTAVRICGFSKNNITRQPLMHHKFVILFNSKLRVKGVWTGSYNFTTNANQSFENSIFITDKNIIMKYLKEFIIVMQSAQYINDVCEL